MNPRFALEDVKSNPEFAEESKAIRKAFETLAESVETLGDRDKKDKVLDKLVEAYKDAIGIIQADIKARKKVAAGRTYALPERDYAEKEEFEGALYAARKKEEYEKVKPEVEKFLKDDKALRAAQAKRDYTGAGGVNPAFPSGHPSQYDKEDPREAPKNIAAGHDPHDSFDPKLPRSPAEPSDIAKASKEPMKASEDTAKDEKDLGEHSQARGGRKAIEEGKEEPKAAAEEARKLGKISSEVSREGPGSKSEPLPPKAAEYNKEHVKAADKVHPSQMPNGSNPTHKDATKKSSGK